MDDFLSFIHPAMHEFTRSVFIAVGERDWQSLDEFERALADYLDGVTETAIATDDHRLADKVLVIREAAAGHLVAAYFYAGTVKGGRVA